VALDDLISTVISMRPFVPARDFDGEKTAHVQLGNVSGAFSFLLQDFYTKEFAENLMMHLLVEDLDGWWQHIASLDLHERFGVGAPRPPKEESWGLRVAYLWDPAGVLWHIASDK